MRSLTILNLHLGGVTVSKRDMEKWFKSLSKKGLRTWIKMMTSPINMFLNSEEDNKNIETARNILKEK